MPAHEHNIVWTLGPPAGAVFRLLFFSVSRTLAFPSSVGGDQQVGPDAKCSKDSPNKNGRGVVKKEGSSWWIKMGDWKLGSVFFFHFRTHREPRAGAEDFCGLRLGAELTVWLSGVCASLSQAGQRTVAC